MDAIKHLQVAVDACKVREFRGSIFSNAEHHTDQVVKFGAVDGVGNSVDHHEAAMETGKASPTGRLINECAADGERGKSR